MPLYNPVFPARDNIFSVVDDVDPTKKMVLQAGTISTGTTRSYTLPDANGQLVLTGGAQTLSSKTLTDTTVLAIKADNFMVEDTTDPTKSFLFDVSAVDTQTGVYLIVPQSGGYIVTTLTASAQVERIITATATLDFPSTLAASSSDLTMTLTGAVDGDSVMLGVPNGSVNVNTAYFAWVSAANTITVRFINFDIALASDPASGVFRATIMRF